MTKDEELKPCPFCGSEPFIKKVTWANVKTSSVGCYNDACLIQPITGMTDEKRAIEIWNKRSPK